MLTSPERVQMTTLVSACQSNLGSSNDKVRITVRCLRMLPDSQGHGSDVDYINPTRVCFGEDVKALQVSCGFNHTGAILEYA